MDSLMRITQEYTPQGVRVYEQVKTGQGAPGDAIRDVFSRGDDWRWFLLAAFGNSDDADDKVRFQLLELHAKAWANTEVVWTAAHLSAFVVAGLRGVGLPDAAAYDFFRPAAAIRGRLPSSAQEAEELTYAAMRKTVRLSRARYGDIGALLRASDGVKADAAVAFSEAWRAVRFYNQQRADDGTGAPPDMVYRATRALLVSWYALTNVIAGLDFIADYTTELMTAWLDAFYSVSTDLGHKAALTSYWVQFPDMPKWEHRFANALVAAADTPAVLAAVHNASYRDMAVWTGAGGMLPWASLPFVAHFYGKEKAEQVAAVLSPALATRHIGDKDLWLSYGACACGCATGCVAMETADDMVPLQNLLNLTTRVTGLPRVLIEHPIVDAGRWGAPRKGEIFYYRGEVLTSALQYVASLNVLRAKRGLPETRVDIGFAPTHEEIASAVASLLWSMAGITSPSRKNALWQAITKAAAHMSAAPWLVHAMHVLGDANAYAPDADSSHTPVRQNDNVLPSVLAWGDVSLALPFMMASLPPNKSEAHRQMAHVLLRVGANDLTALMAFLLYWYRRPDGLPKSIKGVIKALREAAASLDSEASPQAFILWHAATTALGTHHADEQVSHLSASEQIVSAMLSHLLSLDDKVVQRAWNRQAVAALGEVYPVSADPKRALEIHTPARMLAHVAWMNE